MAKKRREKEDEDEIDFKLPKFDEAKFLKKERRNIKTLFISLLLGFVIAIISFGFWALLVDSYFRWELILLLGVFNASWLKYLFLRLNIDLTDFGRKGWFGSYAIYFFTWLIVLIILANPPFYDDESPHVEVVVLPGMQEMGGTVKIVARIIDNVGIEKQDIDFSLIYPDGTNHSPDFTFEDNIFSYTYENSDNLLGEYTFAIEAADINSHKNEVSGSFKYGDDAVGIISSLFLNIGSGDPIVISANEKIGSENFRVYYRIDDGAELNISRKDRNDKEKYETSVEFEGWSSNTNVTVKIYAEVIHYFENFDKKFNNTIEDTALYNFTTGDDSNIGKKLPLVKPISHLSLDDENQPENIFNYYIPEYKAVQVPGFEVVVFLISLAIVALIFKYRKKDKKI